MKTFPDNTLHMNNAGEVVTAKTLPIIVAGEIVTDITFELKVSEEVVTTQILHIYKDCWEDSN